MPSGIISNHTHKSKKKEEKKEDTGAAPVDTEQVGVEMAEDEQPGRIAEDEQSSRSKNVKDRVQVEMGARVELLPLSLVGRKLIFILVEGLLCSRSKEWIYALLSDLTTFGVGVPWRFRFRSS